MGENPRTTIGVTALCLALITLAACSGSDEGGSDSTPPNPVASTPTTAGESSTDIDDNAGVDISPGSVEPGPRSPLGFEAGVFDVPTPPDVSGLPGRFVDSIELIDSGVDAGVWTEAEGVRAVVSIVMGELPPDSIPAIEALPRPHYREVIARAIALSVDTSIDETTRDDLARLTSFFTVEGPLPDQSSSEPGEPQSFAPAGLVRRQTSLFGCNNDFEDTLYKAQATRSCYTKFTDGDDELLLPNDSDTAIVDDVFGLLEQVRTGYQTLTGNELQPASILFSKAISPDDVGDAAPTTLGHVASAVNSRCRVALFVPEQLPDSLEELKFTIAHELWHCIQGTWDGDIGDDLTTEGGADFFAYEVLGKQCAGTGSGSKLDRDTASGSLLSASYEGWFFWAFLAERGHLDVQQVSAAHETISAGTSVEETMKVSVGDLPKTLNEFYVRMVGPGLACDFVGSATTDTIGIDQKGPVELAATDVWSGTRYELNYASGKLYEQRDDGAGPIGMADLDKRADAGAWVVSEPEIRTTCTEDEKWIIVVTPDEVGPSSSARRIEVDAAKPGGCDPCVVGGWSIDLESFANYVETLSQGQDIAINGSFTINFSPGPPDGGLEYSDRRDIQISFPGVDASFSVGLAGTGSATYQSSGTYLSTTGYSDSGTATVNAGPTGASSPFANTGDGGVEYTCDDDDMTVLVNGNPIYATRTPATPAGTPYFG